MTKKLAPLATTEEGMKSQIEQGLKQLAKIASELGSEATKKSTKKASTESKSEKPVVEAKSTPTREIKVDFSTAEAEPKHPKAEVVMSESQETVYETLKTDVPKWDNGKLTKCFLEIIDGTPCAFTEVTQKNGVVVSRKLYIGRNGAIRAYGKKTHSKLTKLLRAYDDVVKYGKKVEEPEV